MPSKLDFFKMPIGQLANYCMAFNFFLVNCETNATGILIGILDLSRSKECVKVLVDGDFQYWSPEQCVSQRAEKRNWQKI